MTSRVITALCGGAATLALTAAAMHQPIAAEATASKTVFVLPAGTYTALVFTAAGMAGASPAPCTFKVGNDQFPVNVGAGETVAIPFGSGWELAKDAEVHLMRGAGTIYAVPHAWAVTPQGPLKLKEK